MNWGLRVDVSFGPAADYQLEVWQRCIDTLPSAMIMYGTDTFWPTEPAEYRESYLQPSSGSSRRQPRRSTSCGRAARPAKITAA